MSYRNEIKCITTKEGFALIDKLVKEASGITEEESECYLTGKSNRKEFFDGKYILLTCEDAKWYDDDPVVEAFERALECLDNMDIPYMFGRVGDNYADVEWKENSRGIIPLDMPRLRVNIKLEMSNDEVIAQLESLRKGTKDRMHHTDEECSISHDDYYALTVAIQAVIKMSKGEL